MNTVKIGDSEYKGVCNVLKGGKYNLWICQGTVKGTRFSHAFNTEREAAICYDKIMLQNGKQAVNILTKKL